MQAEDVTINVDSLLGDRLLTSPTTLENVATELITEITAPVPLKQRLINNNSGGRREIVHISLGKLWYPANWNGSDYLLPAGMMIEATQTIEGGERLVLLSAYALPHVVLNELARLAVLINKGIIIWPKSKVHELPEIDRNSDLFLFAENVETAMADIWNWSIAENHRIISKFLDDASDDITVKVWQEIQGLHSEYTYTKIYDCATMNMGYASQRCIAVNFDLAFRNENTDMFQQKEFMRFFCDKLIAYYNTASLEIAVTMAESQPKTETPVEKELEVDPYFLMQQKDRLVYFMNNYKVTYSKSLKNKIREAHAEKMEHLKGIVRNEQNIRENETLLRSLQRQKAKVEFSPTSIEKTLRNFFSKKMYKKFEVGSDYIVGYTPCIKIEYEGYTFSIGEFAVTIFVNGDIHMANLTNRLDDYDHPHVSNERPCLGNIKEIVPQMIHNGDFCGLFGLLYEYLCSYNNESPYRHVAKWGEEEDWCNDCDNFIEECSCSICENCGRHTDDCICERCPRSGDLLENHDCSQCRHYSSEDGCEY